MKSSKTIAGSGTTIKCEICGGTGINPKPHAHECGACFGSGLSTNSYDQRRNGTTITAWDNEPTPEILADPTTEIHSRTRTYRMNGMRRQDGTIMLISWANKDYRGN